MKIWQLSLLLLLLGACAKARVIQNFSLRQEKKVIAHRGASGQLPEHTREAFALAHAFGADYIEVDVVATKDGKLLALHDLTLDATTNVKEVYPERARKDGHFYALDFTAHELSRLDVHERVHPETGAPVFEKRFPLKNRAALKLTYLDELTELLTGLNHSRSKRVGLYVELKGSDFHKGHGVDLIALFVDEVERLDFTGREVELIVESFNPSDLKRLKNQYKFKHPLVQLLGENSWQDSYADYDFLKTEEGLDEIASYADGIGPWIFHLLRPVSEDVVVTDLAILARSRGLFIHAYTVRKDSLPPFNKSLEELLQMLYLGVKVDGVFTDHTASVVEFLQTYGTHSR